MTKRERNIGLIVLAGLLLLPGAIGGGGDYMQILQTFLPAREGFSAVPLWDYSQWSWGYGTAAGFDPNKKPAGTITRDRAWQEAAAVIQKHYNQLAARVNKKLNSNQWAALLSFSYNTGTGNAFKIVETINTGTAADVITRMKKYVYAGGVYNQGLANRREKETDLYQGIQSYGRSAEMEFDQPLELYGEITDYAY